MKHRSHRLIQTGPVVAGGGEGRPQRTVTVGKREWELRTPGDDDGDTWTWRHTGWFERAWALGSDRGTVLVQSAQGMLSRAARAEAAAGGWTLRRAWNGRITLNDDRDAVLLQYHPGWFGRGRIEPQGGQDLLWRRRWFWRFALETSEGHELLALRRAPGFSNRDWRLTLSESARERTDLLPLVALTWLVVLGAGRHHSH